MAKYKIEIKKSAVKEIKKLKSKELNRVLEKISSLSVEPRPPNSIKLSVDEKYRIRCGTSRIIYEIKDEILVIIIVKVAHRKEVYK